MPQGTAFHRRTSPLNDRLAWADWWGYHAAGRFGDDLEIEYNAVREACGAIDVSPLFKYRISGPDAGRLIDRVITRDAAKLQPGQVYYTPWCDERGKLVDDGTVSALDDGTYRWTAAEPNYRWIRQNATRLDAHVEDISAEVAALALQGPTSRSILESATNQDWSDVKYFRRRAARIGGVDVDVTRTGYTGDLGYEIWVSSDLAVELWDALFAAGEAFGLRPVGMDALDVLRVEAGLILLDAEFTGVRNAFSPEQEYSPFELGLGRLVNFKKPRFVGRTALLAEQDAGGPPRSLVGMELDWEGLEAAYESHGLPVVFVAGTSTSPTPVHAGGRHIGRATSMTWSPILKKVISLGVIQRANAPAGSPVEVEWTVEGTHERVGATVVELPFFDPPRKRA